MKFVALLAAGAATAVTAAPHWSKLDESYSFEAWLAEHKDASPVEPTKEAFTANLARILAHNKEESTWKAGVNKVSQHTFQHAPVGWARRGGPKDPAQRGANASEHATRGKKGVGVRGSDARARLSAAAGPALCAPGGLAAAACTRSRGAPGARPDPRPASGR
jgi:hypothetical protein